MEKLSTKCANCQCVIRYPETSEGKVVNCPKCKTATKLVAISTNSNQEHNVSNNENADLNTKQPSQEKAENIISNFSEFPERMKASKALVGINCTHCNEPIDLGDDIINCKSCNSSIMHQKCYENKSACGNSMCNEFSENKPAIKNENKNEDNASSDMKDCPYCGEKIKALSKKCRFCGEYLDRKLRAKENQTKKNDAEDEKLSITEIIFCALCGGLACIVSIVYIIQGKKKAWKMLGISLLSQLMWTLIRSLNKF